MLPERRQSTGDRDALDARKRLQAIEGLSVEVPVVGRRSVRSRRKREVGHQHVPRVESQIGSHQLDERAHQEPRAKQEHDRERDLRDDEAAPHAGLSAARRAAAPAHVGAGAGIAPRALQRREETEPHRSDGRCQEREDQDRLIHSQLGFPGNPLPRHEPGQRRNSRVGQQAAGDQATERQQRALDQELPDDAASACANRGAYADLPLARRGAREEHVGHVAARHHQQQGHGAEERVQHTAELADDPVDDVITSKRNWAG